MNQTDKTLRSKKCRQMARALIVLLPLLLMSLSGSLVAQDQEAANDTTSKDTALADSVSPDLTRAYELLGQLETTLDSIRHLASRMTGKEDEELDILRVQGRRQVEVLDDIQPELLKRIPKLEEKDLPTDEIKQRFQAVLIFEMELYEEALKWWAREIDDFRDSRTSTPPEQLDELETQIGEARDRLDKILRGQTETLTMADSLGMSTAKVWHGIERILKQRAETLVGRLQISVTVRDRIESKIHDMERAGAPESELGVERTRLQHAKRRVDGVAKSLERTADLLGARGFETTQYRQFIIKTTGEISERILDPRVLVGLIRDYAKDMWVWLKDNAPTAFVKFLIVLVFVVVFRLGFRLGWWLMQLVRLASLTRLMSDLVGRLISPVATLLGLFSGLWFLGVNPTTLLAGLGVAGVIVGFALQDSLANLAAGFFILATRPFDVDDTISGGGVLGTVKAMGVANTTIITFDGRRLMVPNRKIWGEVIENRSAESVRRVDITVRVGYAEDLNRALEVLRDLVKGDERVLSAPEPSIFVSDLEDSWIEIAVRPWVRNKDWWPFLTDLPRLVRLRFAKEGIEIPYPRTEFSTPGDRIPGSDRSDTEE